MASQLHTWQVTGFQDLREGGCLYGPEFTVANYYFQLQLHPVGNSWSEAGILFLTLISELGSIPDRLFNLKIRTTFTAEQLKYKHSRVVKDSVAQWRGGFGPQDTWLNSALAQYTGDDLTLGVLVEILEEETPSTTVFRWPIETFEDIRLGHTVEPCRAGFHAYLTRRFEVLGLACPLAFRVVLHPSIDATGNVYVSFRLDKSVPLLSELELKFELILEEVGFTAQSETLRGNMRAWSRPLGVASQPTQCSSLSTYSGLLTLKLHVRVTSCVFQKPKSPPVWTDFVSPEFKYLILSAAGPDVLGIPEPLHEELLPANFARACACNVNILQSLLAESGVPAESVQVADFSGESEQCHPRELVEAFVRQPESAAKLVLYFTGHATKEGAWCLRWRPHGQRYAADVTVTPQDVFAWKLALQPNTARVPLEVIVESVYAGAWCVGAKEAQLHGRVFAACAPTGQAWATSHGSLFTSWLAGRGQPPTSVRVPGGQAPWECSRLGAAGPAKLLGAEAQKAAPAQSPQPPSSAAALNATLPAVMSPAAATLAWPAAASRSQLVSPSSTGWAFTPRRPPSAGVGASRRLVAMR